MPFTFIQVMVPNLQNYETVSHMKQSLTRKGAAQANPHNSSFWLGTN